MLSVAADSLVPVAADLADPAAPAVPVPPREAPTGGAADADRFLLHVRSLAAVTAFLKARGEGEAGIAALLARHGLAGVDQRAYDGFLPMARFARLLQGVARHVGEETVGLKLGEMTQHAGLGVLGQAVATAPTLLDAMDLLATRTRLYADVSYTSFTVTRDRAEFSWAYSRLLVAMDQLADRGAGLFVNTFRTSYAPHFAALEVHLQRPAPTDPAPYRRMLAPVVLFDAPANMVAFRADLLDRPNPHADPYAHEAALQLVERMMQERRVPDDLSIRVREDIMAHLEDGAGGVAETARRLGLSTRALQRRLDELGTSYQTMGDEVRRALAQELLRQSSLPMGEIAWRLGFSNQANLTRACRRWFGASPRRVRGMADA